MNKDEAECLDILFRKWSREKEGKTNFYEHLFFSEVI